MSADLTSLFVHLLKWKKRTISTLRLLGDMSIESESNNFSHGKIFLAKIKKLIMVNSSLVREIVSSAGPFSCSSD